MDKGNSAHTERKRKRSANWDSLEKNLLRSCIKEFVSVIENKNTDTNTNKAKNLAWQEITKRFNELNKQERTIVEMKQQWRTTKLDAKKKLSSYNRERNGTGGGQKPPSPDPVTNEILEMIPQEFEVDFNQFDSDGIILQDIKCNSTQSEIKITPVNTAVAPVNTVTDHNDVLLEIINTPIRNKENIEQITHGMTSDNRENCANRK